MKGLRWLLALIVLLLAACNQQPTPTPAPFVTPVTDPAAAPRRGSATASGVVVPAMKAQLSFPTTGRVHAVWIDVGDTVAAGEPLIGLENVAAQAAVTRAQATLFQAQATLAALVAGPRVEEIAIAQAAVEGAAAQRAQLTEAARPEDVAAARADLVAAQVALRQLNSGPREAERITALAALANAKAALQQAQSAYNQVSWSNDIGARPESRNLQEATNNYEAAQARYDALYGGPTADVAAAAQARVQQAQAALDRLLTPGSPNQIAVAEAQLHAAEAQLELLKADARDEEVAAAAAAVTQAEAELLRVETDLANLTLRAPFTGTVTAVNLALGEMAQPGTTAVTLADLTTLRVETTDFSERDIEGIQIGQSATVFVEALKQEVTGHLLRIAPQASTIGGDVVYTLTIALSEQPTGLRWGMSVEVDLGR